MHEASNVFDELKKYNIEPLVTISHYEMPLNLVKKHGGWRSKKIISYYTRYAETIFKRYKGKVRYWITFSKKAKIKIEPEDKKILKEGVVDFLAFSYYFSRIAPLNPKNDPNISDNERMGVLDNPYLKKTEWGWVMDPVGLDEPPDKKRRSYFDRD